MLIRNEKRALEIFRASDFHGETKRNKELNEE